MKQEQPNFENNEAMINQLIEDLAHKEEMEPDEIFSDINTFFALSEGDEDAKFYFEELAEKIGIPFEQMMEYAAKKSE